jgi:hypothetical protein
MEAFQLRLWDGRIGRWLSPDPMGQHASPYAGMGNNPVSHIDPDGGYETWFGAFVGWVGGGFKGGIEHTGGAGNHNYSVLHEGRVLNHGSGNVLNTVIPDYRQYGKVSSGSSSSFNMENWWDNSTARRSFTGDKIGFTGGFDASFFIGGGAGIEINWILTGRDKSFFPYIGNIVHGTISTGGNLSVDLEFNHAFHSGPSSAVKASSLPGWEHGIEVGAKYFGGVDLGYSYSADGEYGWHQKNASIGVGFEASPFTAVNVKYIAEYNFLQLHTGTGTWYTNK